MTTFVRSITAISTPPWATTVRQFSFRASPSSISRSAVSRKAFALAARSPLPQPLTVTAPAVKEDTSPPCPAARSAAAVKAAAQQKLSMQSSAVTLSRRRPFQ